MLGLRGVTTIVLVVLSLAYQGIRPPPPKICGSPGGPPITAPRVRLRDHRNLAYKEQGVPRELAKHKIVYVHGSHSCRHDAVIATDVTPAVLEEMKVYVLSFDRPGYGESDPDPKRTPKSLALDIEELADQLGLGTKFYVIGYSMGGQAIWGVLKYIPHRLAGVALIAPVINYWWPGFPTNLSSEGYYLQPPQDQWALRVAHHAPWLTYWWNTQKWFPASSVAARAPHIMSRQDMEIIPKMIGRRKDAPRVNARLQGEAESIHRDMTVGFGSWEFDPMEIENPFPNKEESVHLWQGDEDRLVPVLLQRHIAQKLPWIEYHELPGAGHLLPYADGMSEAILKALIVDQKQS